MSQMLSDELGSYVNVGNVCLYRSYNVVPRGFARKVVMSWHTWNSYSAIIVSCHAFATRFFVIYLLGQVPRN